jgi:hypothetical protein
MTSVLNSKAVNVTLLDAVPATGYAGQPLTQISSGEGGPAFTKSIEDSIVLPVTFFSATGNYARILRFPTNAKVKSVEVHTDIAVDAAATTGAAAFYVGVAFSDSTSDGTPPAYQGLQPTTVGIGGGSTTAGTTVAINGSSANEIFGTVTAPATTGAIPVTNITYQGVGATYGTALAITQTPLVELFNFLDGNNKPLENLGYFDLIAVVSHAYTTVPTGTAELYTKLTFTDV